MIMLYFVMSGSALLPHGLNPLHRRSRFATKGVQRGTGRSPFPSGGVIHKRATSCLTEMQSISTSSRSELGLCAVRVGHIKYFENVPDVFYLICAEGTTSLAEGVLHFRASEYFTSSQSIHHCAAASPAALAVENAICRLYPPVYASTSIISPATNMCG